MQINIFKIIFQLFNILCHLNILLFWWKVPKWVSFLLVIQNNLSPDINICWPSQNFLIISTSYKSFAILKIKFRHMSYWSVMTTHFTQVSCFLDFRKIVWIIVLVLLSWTKKFNWRFAVYDFLTIGIKVMWFINFSI